MSLSSGCRTARSAREGRRAAHDDLVGALVTLEVAAGSPVVDLPWIITFGPLDDGEDWEPVVCGPYERPHALALARAVVADDDLLAVVEPLLPRVSVAEIRAEVEQARLGPEDRSSEQVDDEDGEPMLDPGTGPPAPPGADQVLAGFARIAARLIEPPGPA
jgi:hypothetical protein